MTDRISCCVPGCKRTTKRWADAAEWICGKHWPAVPKYMKRRDTKLLRAYKKRFGTNGFWEYPAGSPKRIEAVRLSRLCEKSWGRCKAHAIEAAMGIG